MDSLPTWAVWSIVMALVLLSPVIAFLLALAVEILICALVDEGAPVALVFGAAGGGLFLFRRLRIRSRRCAISGEA
jgi:hypothetical protein